MIVPPFIVAISLLVSPEQAARVKTANALVAAKIIDFFFIKICTPVISYYFYILTIPYPISFKNVVVVVSNKIQNFITFLGNTQTFLTYIVKSVEKIIIIIFVQDTLADQLLVFLLVH